MKVCFSAIYNSGLFLGPYLGKRTFVIHSCLSDFPNIVGADNGR